MKEVKIEGRRFIYYATMSAWAISLFIDEEGVLLFGPDETLEDIISQGSNPEEISVEDAIILTHLPTVYKQAQSKEDFSIKGGSNGTTH